MTEATLVSKLVWSTEIVWLVTSLTLLADDKAVAAALNLADLTAVTGGARLLLPIDGLWRGVVFNLQPAATRLLIEGFTRAGENAAAFAAANPFFATNPPSLPYLGWVGAWIVAMLALAIVLFRRREP